MTKQRGIGTYLAQGWAANATVTYLLLLGFILLKGSRNDLAEVVIFAPIYFSIMGVPGGAVGMLIWIVEEVTGRKINVLYRGAGAIVLPALLAMAAAALAGFPQNVVLALMWIASPLVVLVLPAALLSGSRLNPLGFIVMNLSRDLPRYGWSRALSIIVVPLMRLAAALGTLESLLYLATLRSPDLGSWNVAEKQFVGAVFAVVYFAITLIVSLCLPEKVMVVVAGIVLNAPIVTFAVMVQQQGSFNYQSFAIIGWILISLWILFILSQWVRSETRRIIPVTMFEIRIRHAFNYW
jgi:hypothetical protein